MGDTVDESKTPLDVLLDSAGREEPAGTTPANVYVRDPERESISIAPDFAPYAEQPAWRHDFPIDWPLDQYVERRDFMKFMVLTSLAFTVGQLWIAAESWMRKRRVESGVLIASVDDLAIGGTRVFQYPGPHDPCVLVRLGTGELVAYGQKCTHLSCAVIPRPDAGVLQCPCHDGVFDLRSGRPTAGPPRRPLPRIKLDIRGREIYATGIEWRMG